MYYVKIDKNDKKHLINWCRTCMREEIKELQNNNCIYKNNFNNDNIISFKDYINSYTHLDPALPRVNNIDCPNKNCISHTESDKKEVIYIKYDNINLKYIYLCCNCKSCWKNELENQILINL
tara:strand:- start:1892 stop:2257 length:366 start_codon:yes stop_codon:yes gene_type:complete